MIIKKIKNEYQLKEYIFSLNISDILKDERIYKIINTFKDENIEVEFDINSDNLNFTGYANKGSSIKIYVLASLFDNISKYLRNGGFFGDISCSNNTFAFKKDLDILVFSIILTLLHEYKHCIQYSEGLMEGVNTEYNNGYISDEAMLLEYEAEKFAYDNIRKYI